MKIEEKARGIDFLMRDHDYIRIEFVFLTQLFLLLILNTLSRTNYDLLKEIGNLSINLSLVFMYLVLIKVFFERKNVAASTYTIVYIALFLEVFIYSISFFTNSNVDGEYFIKLILLFLFILGALRIRWNLLHAKMFAYMFAAIFIFIFLHWIQLDFPHIKFKSIFNNPNYLAVLLFTMLYFKILAIVYGTFLERIYFSILVILNLVLIYNTNSRSVLLVIAVILLAKIILKFYSKFFHLLFYFALIVNFVFLAVYINLQNTKIGILINNLSIKVFRKSIFSGRNILWEQILQNAKEKPILGYGIGTNARDLTGIYNLTAHNQYIQTYIELGIIGLLAFIFLLYSIWWLLQKRLDNVTAQWSACFFIGILIYENFELTLFQNNYSIAMLQWLIIAMGVSFNNEIKNKATRIQRREHI